MTCKVAPDVLGTVTEKYSLSPIELRLRLVNEANPEALNDGPRSTAEAAEVACPLA